MYLELRSDKKKVVLNTNNKHKLKKQAKQTRLCLQEKSKQFIATTNKTKKKTIKRKKTNKFVFISNNKQNKQKFLKI